LVNNEPIDQNPYDMFREAGAKLKWDNIHTRLKGFNKSVKEFDAIEMYDEMLPKDKVLRAEAIERIIRTKKEEVDKNLRELASKYQSDVLEDKYKI
jgi:heme oxygenase